MKRVGICEACRDFSLIFISGCKIGRVCAFYSRDNTVSLISDNLL